MKDSAKKQIMKLIDKSNRAYVSSVDEEGYPNTKCMFALNHVGYGLYYFSTNLSSLRAKQYAANPKASVYFCKLATYQGVMLIGDMEICTDPYHKELLWNPGDEQYYSKGVTDEDYIVYKFIAKKFRYYPGDRETFDISELLDSTKEEIKRILTKFAQSGWEVIDAVSKEYLNGANNREELIKAVMQADKECGSCGCEFDPLYKELLDLKDFL